MRSIASGRFFGRADVAELVPGEGNGDDGRGEGEEERMRLIQRVTGSNAGSVQDFMRMQAGGPVTDLQTVGYGVSVCVCVLSGAAPLSHSAAPARSPPRCWLALLGPYWLCKPAKS